MNAQAPPRHSPARAIPRRAWRIARWPLYGLVGLLVSSWIAVSIGTAIYNANGQPANYEKERRLQRLRTIAAMMTSFPINQGLGQAHRMYLGPRFGFLGKVHPNVSGVQVGRLVVHSDDVATLVGQEDHTAAETRFCLLIEGADEAIAAMLVAGAARPTLGAPAARAGLLHESPALYEVAVWRNDEILLTVEARRDGKSRYTIIINAVHQTDPRFRTRWETGGLMAGHRHAEEVRRQLREGAPPPAEVPPPTPPSPFLGYP